MSRASQKKRREKRLRFALCPHCFPTPESADAEHVTSTHGFVVSGDRIALQFCVSNVHEVLVRLRRGGQIAGHQPSSTRMAAFEQELIAARLQSTYIPRGWAAGHGWMFRTQEHCIPAARARWRIDPRIRMW